MNTSNVEDIYELTPLQQGMLLHSLHDGAADMYLSQQTYRADGPLDPAALVSAWQTVVNAHPALRTSFHWEGLDKPLQVVHREVSLPVTRHDWSGLDEPQQRRQLEQLRADDSGKGFDLAVAPLQRLQVIRLGADRHYLIWTYHHLLMDGWSVAIFFSDVLAHYRHLTVGGPPPPSPPPFRTYIAWLQRQDPEATRSFWADLLGGISSRHLSTLKPWSPSRSTGAVDRRNTEMPARVVEGLRDAAARHRVTLGTMIQAAWAIVLRRFTGGEEITFGSASSGRPPEIGQVDRIVGVFANTLPVRITVPADGDLGPWLRDIQHTYAQMRRYEHTPLADIKRWAGVTGQQLFDSSVSLETYPSVIESRAGGQSLTFHQEALYDKINYPVALTIAPEAQTVQLLTHRERFEPGFIDELGASLHAAFEALITADRIAPVAAAAGPVVATSPIDVPGAPGSVGAVPPEHAPATALEESIAAVYRDVLELPTIDADVSFFELGGDSFDAVRAVGRIDGASIGTLAAHPSVRELAAALTSQQPDTGSELDREITDLEGLLAAKRAERDRQTDPRRVVPVPRDAAMPCTYQQEAVWFIHQVNPTSTSYHVPFALRLRGDLDVPALERALHALVTRHEALRTRFVDQGGLPRQVVDPTPAALRLPFVELDDDEVDRWAEAECSRPFDLEAGPVFRTAMARVAPKDHVLLLVAHHIVTDGWSAAIIGRELSALYTAAVTGRDADLPDLPVQPADFAAWQRRWLAGAELDRQLGYWRDKLAGLTPMRFPTDRPRPVQPTGAGTAVTRWLPRDVADAARAYARTHRVSFLAVLKAALLTVLHRYTGQRDLAVGSLFSGRTHVDIDALAGFFGNTVVLRTDLGGDPTFAELVRRCHDTVIGATAHQDVPFHLVVDALRPPRVAGGNPLFQMTLTLHPTGITGADLRLGDVRVETVSVEDRYAMFDVAVDVADVPDGNLGVSVEYSTELFDDDRMIRFLDDYTAALTHGVSSPGTPVDALACSDNADRPARPTPAPPDPVSPRAVNMSPARTDTERQLAAIWQELLGVDRVGAGDHFFDLGGNSLHTTQLVARIRETTGRHLNPHQVFVTPVLGQLAAWLDGPPGVSGAPRPAADDGRATWVDADHAGSGRRP
ncbi:hypothetical protein CA850_23205 [Micromonospora echinospora]|uniref:Non-ribosomal peptide synthetase component F n=1 Tax=Micromonospora echinospora TaxID=1877 RepID=A0A1C4YS10_MICEC|nr:condensation domain-containing protein [Micromonospora echinospora]OZV77366.1 hypothetical protein CA850_23205 [Micromonospora echinospora]SCF23543.1 Non-ribosomal peptide synthetase component F [Micromonospora echinospora]